MELEPESLVEAIGGEKIMATRQILDPDMQDPRFEMELSPSRPFRRRSERRLMIMDDSVAPMRPDPREEPIVPLDLRKEKERLISICETGAIRLGRLNALGSWGDAVLVAHSAQDLRGIALMMWVLDPTVDLRGRRRSTRLSPKEFEEKVLCYEKRLDELQEEQILAALGTATFTRRGDLLGVDVLESDGTWDTRKSIELEMALAAVERFSLIPGAPASKTDEEKMEARKQAEAKRAEPPPHDAHDAHKPAESPLRAVDANGHLVVIFPPDRFDLDVAAALGKRDWESILHPNDLERAQRDRLFSANAEFIAPVEFLSEVFVDGKPLTKPLFEQSAEAIGNARVMRVHFPRFGSVLLIELPERRRFVSSLTDPPDVLELLQ